MFFFLTNPNRVSIPIAFQVIFRNAGVPLSPPPLLLNGGYLLNQYGNRVDSVFAPFDTQTSLETKPPPLFVQMDRIIQLEDALATLTVSSYHSTASAKYNVIIEGFRSL